MNILKYVLFSFILVICFSIFVFAQEKGEERGDIPKPNPPVIIVNPDKKSDDKSKEKGHEGKRENKPQI